MDRENAKFSEKLIFTTDPHMYVRIPGGKKR